MKEQALKLARYWRNSLADSENGRGALRSVQCRPWHRLSREVIQTGELDAKTVSALFDRKEKKTEKIPVVLRPFVYSALREHGKKFQSNLPDVISPMVTLAFLARDGRLYPEAGSIIPRDLLEPLERGSYRIGSVKDLARVLSKAPIRGITFPQESDKEHTNQWKDYLAACEALLTDVCRDWQKTGIVEADYGFLELRDEETIPGQHLIRLYDSIHQHKPDVPLFEQFAVGDQQTDGGFIY